MRQLELEHVGIKRDLTSMADDIREIKEGRKEDAKKTDERLGTIAKLLWSAVALLFTVCITAFGILVSQGGIH